MPVVSNDPGYAGLRGLLPQVASHVLASLGARAEPGALADCEIFASGPDGMVAQAERLLADRIPAGRLHHDPPARLTGR